MPRQSKANSDFEEPLIEIVSTKEKVQLTEHPILVFGFPGPGLVGTIAANRMIDALRMKTIAVIRSPLIPPVTPFFGGVLRPPMRICASEDGRFITVISEVPLPAQTSFFFANRILDWAEKQGVKKVICLEGVGVGRRRGTPMVYGAAEPKLLEELEKHDIPKVTKGMVAGIAGAIMNECLIRRLDGYCLMVTAVASSPDPEAAASMVRTVNRFLDLDISIQPLIRNRTAIKAQLNDLARHVRREEQLAEKQGFRPIPFYV